MRIIQAEFSSVEVKKHPTKTHEDSLTWIEFFSIPLDLVTVLDKKELVDLKEKIELRLKEMECELKQ